MNGQQHYKAAEELLRAIEEAPAEARKRGDDGPTLHLAVEILQARMMGHIGLAHLRLDLGERPDTWNEDYQ